MEWLTRGSERAANSALFGRFLPARATISMISFIVASRRSFLSESSPFDVPGLEPS